MNRFVFVAPMYNASAYVGRMLHSICGQSYENWKVVLIDDVSSNEERQAEAEIITQFQRMKGCEGKIELLWNNDKLWEVANVLQGIDRCEEDDIVCRIDADDWLTDLDALMMIDAKYRTTGCDVLWTAHRWSYSDRNISAAMPPNADPYKYPWVSSHLKTFRKRLITNVPDENFRGPDGNYIRRAGDQCLYLPVLHKSQHKEYLPRCTYHYTINDVPATYQTDDAKFQKSEADFIRQRGYVKTGETWESKI